MKRTLKVLVAVVLVIAGSVPLLCQQVFEVNLNDRSGDTFKVTLHPVPLSDANAVFQFAASAPGVYQVMDIGRFVNNFRAFDRSGEEVPTTHTSTDQWTLTRPRDVATITYTVDDIWNTKIKEDEIYPMCSSTISDDFVMMNGQCVFGYFTGMQTEPIKIKVDYPAAWTVGTALTRDKDGYYEAEDFDKVVDSPFFLGKMSTATTTIGGAAIDVFTYSKTGLIPSDSTLACLRSILKAESDFTRGLPVDRYVFLFYFGDVTVGAWEHSYSSEYVFREDTLKPGYVAAINTIVAHEFFHVNVPLNLHSELVEHFNFVKPVMSQHLWLYEGTTEWAAHILQLRDGLITLRQYLQTLQGQLNANDAFDQHLSLTALGVNSTQLQDQYVNIYQKGALVSTLLDIRLLELSHGKAGLRELLLELSKKYGKKRAFSEEGFFSQLVTMTYPEIGDFIKRYIQGTDKLPVLEYFRWLGIDYQETGEVDSSQSSLGVGLRPVDEEIGVTMVYDDSKSGLKVGDIIKKIDGTPLTFGNVQSLFGKLRTEKPGTTVIFTVRRDGTETNVAAILQPRVTRHIFTVDPDATPAEKALREVWMKNM
ncbi:MAG TPA: PDZ domain-containing protein [Bacteroidota bacterium]|nr:PDZ domain-containing protein [Bacteroidota bacterium]